MFKMITEDVHIYQIQLLTLNLERLNHNLTDHKILIKISKIAVILLYCGKTNENHRNIIAASFFPLLYDRA